MTANQLLNALKLLGCCPAVEGETFILESPPPEEWLVRIAILQTGLRAILTGKRWFGIDPATGHAVGPHPARSYGPLAFGALDPNRLLPRTVGTLCVEGDRLWDRLPPLAPEHSPELFAPVVEHSKTAR